LRQEFRELELLDEITKLRHQGHLPRRVAGIYRGQLLASYRAWKGVFPDPEHFNSAIRSKPDDGNPVNNYGSWRPTLENPKSGKGVKKQTQSKRKPEAGEHAELPAVKKQAINSSSTFDTQALPPLFVERPVQPVSPVGLIWDSTNYSCAYDALFTPLACLWDENPEMW
ncbi:hypothetical protein C8R44DRAFT_583657, partial [Mycena epipterygia]